MMAANFSAGKSTDVSPGWRKMVHQPEIITVHCHKELNVLFGQHREQHAAPALQMLSVSRAEIDIQKMAHVAGAVGLDMEFMTDLATSTVGGDQPVRCPTLIADHEFYSIVMRLHASCFMIETNTARRSSFQRIEKHLFRQCLRAMKVRPRTERRNRLSQRDASPLFADE
ncbi:MAG: hypothetical protein WDN00_07070 [Limisphaerales bacterium]